MTCAARRSSAPGERRRTFGRLTAGAVTAAIGVSALTGCVAAPLLGNFMFERFERVPPADAQPSHTEVVPPETALPAPSTPDPSASEPAGPGDT